MLAFGYNAGLPAGVSTAWGCRAIIHQITGSIDVPPDRHSAVGPHKQALLDHLNQHVGDAWEQRAGELLRSGQMHTRRAQEFVLHTDDQVIIKGNTQASAGYLYVCAYLRAEADQL